MKTKRHKRKIVAVIQARVGSTRLPKKILLDVCGRTIFEWIVYRLTFCRNVDQVVLSTAATVENKPLVNLAQNIGLDYYVGSENDLVERIHNTAKAFSATAIVRITGDCPFVDSKIVDSLAATYFKNLASTDYVSNIFPPTFPDGMDVEIISFKTLQRLFDEVKDPLYREWITTTIMEHPERFKILNVAHQPDLSHIRLSVDYREDIELTRQIFTALHQEGRIFHLEDVLNLLKRKPELLEINKNRVDTMIKGNIRSRAFLEAKHGH